MRVTSRSPKRSKLRIADLVSDLGWILTAIFLLVLTMMIGGMQVTALLSRPLWLS
jgi:hypothetical protein